MGQKNISIIVPVYNSEKHLEKCIDSIIEQDIGFEDNIELILINDGSTDLSGSICKSYQCLYPDNIQYFEKDNGGVSSARNMGVANVHTKYFGFVDSDDYITSNTISSIDDYFENSNPESAVAVIRVMNVGAKDTPHATNDKFEVGSSTHDLRNPDSSDVCARVAPAFFRTEKVMGHRFDESVTAVYEDTKYLTDILCEYPLLGVVNKGIYYYRRFKSNASSNSSITTGITEDKRFYNETFERIILAILKKKAGNSPMSKYLDYVALYTLRWVLLYNPSSPKELLSESEYCDYLKLREQIFSLIPDSSIASFELIPPYNRIYLLSIKHNTLLYENLTCKDNGDLLYNDNKISNVFDDTSIRVTCCSIDNNILTIKGVLEGALAETVNLQITINNVNYDGIQISNDCASINKLENDEPFVASEFIFKMLVDDNENRIVRFFIATKNKTAQIDTVKLKKRKGKNSKSYWIEKEHYIYRTKKSITILRKTKFNLLLITGKRGKRKIETIIRKTRGAK